MPVCLFLGPARSRGCQRARTAHGRRHTAEPSVAASSARERLPRVTQVLRREAQGPFLLQPLFVVSASYVSLNVGGRKMRGTWGSVEGQDQGWGYTICLVQSLEQQGCGQLCPQSGCSWMCAKSGFEPGPPAVPFLEDAGPRFVPCTGSPAAVCVGAVWAGELQQSGLAAHIIGEAGGPGRNCNVAAGDRVLAWN